jgi:hypothetical protein
MKVKLIISQMEEKHFYYTVLAKQYGLTEALLLTNIIFWIQKNMKNNKNYHNGRYWMYNSAKKFQEKNFPELNERKINYALRKLENNNVLIVGNFNKKKYDKTKWYSLGKEMKQYYFNFEPEYYKEKPYDNFVIWILQFCHMQFTILVYGNDKIVKPIPYINTYNESKDINTLFIVPHKYIYDFQYFRNKWNEFAKLNNLDEILKLSDKRKAGIKSRLKEKDFDFDKILDNISKSNFLLGKVKNWKVTFDWIFTHKDNYIKILENNYTNNGNKERRNKQQEYIAKETY